MTTAEKIRAEYALLLLRGSKPTIGDVCASLRAIGWDVKRQAVRSALRSRSGRRGPPRGKGVCERCGAMPCYARKPVAT